jgi:ribosome-interacting GTPase 1
MRLNQKPPDITIKRKDKGGIHIIKSMNLELTNISDQTIKSICAEYKISNADIGFGCNANVE